MKKIIVSLLLLLPLGLVAQDLKIAYINTQEALESMPEYSNYLNEMEELSVEIQTNLKSISDDYERKYADLMAKGDSLNENIRQFRVEEITQIQERYETYSASSQQIMAQKQQELFAPIREKLRKAIDNVGEESGYVYIFDAQVFQYIGSSAVNVTDKVKAKLTAK